MAASVLIWFCSVLLFCHHCNWAILQYHNVVYHGRNDGCVTPVNAVNPLATRDLAEKHVLKLVDGFFGHCRAV